jgi:hypothetical protein
MAPDIINGLSSNELNKFKKDFNELVRISTGVSKEYAKQSKDIDKYLVVFKKVIDMFNKKYSGITIKIKKTAKDLKMRIFLKGGSVNDVFKNVASKIDGMIAIGANDFDAAKIEEGDKFSKELQKIDNKFFISYLGEESKSGHIYLEQSKGGMLELHYDDQLANIRSPQFKLCSYYAVNGGIKDIDIYEMLASVGFLERPGLHDVRKFRRTFYPRIEE